MFGWVSLLLCFCVLGCQEMADVWAPTQALNEDLERRENPEAAEKAQAEAREAQASDRLQREVEWMNEGPPADREGRIRWLVRKRIECSSPECSDQLLRSLRAEGDLRPVLVGMLSSDEVSVRLESVILLGVSGNDAVVSDVAGALRDVSPLVRRSAANALGWLKSPASVRPLIERLHEVRDGGERCWLLRALVGLPGEAPLQAFRRAALSNNSEQAHTGLQGLRARGDDSVMEVLKDVINQAESLSVKRGALDVVASLDSRRARQYLRRAARSRDPQVKAHARALRARSR